MMHEEKEEIPTQPYPQEWLRLEMKARWIAVLNHRRENRGILLAPWQTRAIRSGDIHEVITTPQIRSSIQEQINEVYYIGFAEFEAGIIAIGDEMWDNNHVLLGHVIGFDETHAPNHLNILLTSPDRLSGTQLRIQPGTPLFIHKQT